MAEMEIVDKRASLATVDGIDKCKKSPVEAWSSGNEAKRRPIRL